MDDAPRKQAQPGASPANERFARLYDSEMPRVYRYVSYQVGSPEEAEELTADIFSCALRLWPQVADRAGSPRAWLFSMAHNLLAGHLRQQPGRPATPLERRFELRGGPLTPEEVEISKKGIAALLARLAGLPEGDRDVLALRFGGGLGHREVGEVLGIGEGPAAVALLQALRRLHECYQGGGR